jgi:hypothetical protein
MHLSEKDLTSLLEIMTVLTPSTSVCVKRVSLKLRCKSEKSLNGSMTGTAYAHSRSGLTVKLSYKINVYGHNTY